MPEHAGKRRSNSPEGSFDYERIRRGVLRAIEESELAMIEHREVEMQEETKQEEDKLIGFDKNTLNGIMASITMFQ